MFKSACHIHSTYSDGEFGVAELREIYLAAGCRLVLITDHAEYFDEARRDEYVRECARLSDERLTFIPGFEYGCHERMHILGYGTTALAETKDPQEIIEHIEATGGISVIAHPKTEMFGWIESFERLPQGIEVWNSKYDGRYAPRPGTFRLLQGLQGRKPEMRAFFGQDLHWRKQYRGLFSVVNAATTSREDVHAALCAGNFVGVKDDIKLASDGRPDEELLAKFGAVHERSDRMRRFVKGVKGTADRFGLQFPSSLKAQIRRIF